MHLSIFASAALTDAARIAGWDDDADPPHWLLRVLLRESRYDSWSGDYSFPSGDELTIRAVHRLGAIGKFGA